MVLCNAALPGWLSGVCVGLMTWWLRVLSPDEVNFLFGVFSPLTLAEACEKGSRWLWKENCVSTNVRKPETHMHHRPPRYDLSCQSGVKPQYDQATNLCYAAYLQDRKCQVVSVWTDCAGGHEPISFADALTLSRTRLFRTERIRRR